MRPMERLAVYGGIALALIIALSGGGGRAAAGGPAADAVKIGTVDVYAIIEKLMGS